MKKFFLFVAAVAALSLASCGGGDASSTPDGNSQNPGIDPNAPGAQPPLQSNTSAPTVEENTASAAGATSTPATNEEQQKAAAESNQADNPEATNIDPNA